MQIFKHRPLCLIISFLIAFMAVSRFMSVASKIIIVLAAAGISVFVTALFKEDKAFWHRVGIAALGVTLLWMVALRSIVFFNNAAVNAEKLYGLSGWARVKITEVGYTDTYLSVIEGDMLTLNGEKADVRIYIECEYETDYFLTQTKRNF